ncbi:hypothetical protein [Azospirillum sp. sgz302134]
MSRWLDRFHGRDHATASPYADIAEIAENGPTANFGNNGNFGTGESEGDPSPATDCDADWRDPAALGEFDAGLWRAEAEVDARHPAPLQAEPADWGRWFDREVMARAPVMGWAAAERRVWGIALDLWHRLHGARPDPHRCAGCGEHLDGAKAFVLPDGALVHDDGRLLRCLNAYGRRWRRRAAAALAAVGLAAPERAADDS